MKTVFAFTTGLLVGAVGIAYIYMANPHVQDAWQTLANSTRKW